MLWLLASVVCLVGVLLCVTLILLPLGVVLLRVGRRLFSASLALFLPRAARHPVTVAGEKAKGLVDDAASAVDVKHRKRALRKGARRSQKKVKELVG